MAASRVGSLEAEEAAGGGGEGAWGECYVLGHFGEDHVVVDLKV